MYVITTAQGDRYLTDKDGYVMEYSNGFRQSPDSELRKAWQITGVWYKKGFGYIGYMSLESIAILAARNRENLFLRSGKPRYGLTDIDHGTQRLQGNKNAHGVISIVGT